MDAEMMAVTYSLYPEGGGSKGTAVAKGKIGVPLRVEEGRYLLKIHTSNPIEHLIELKAPRNRWAFNVDGQGTLKVARIE